ncbi:hypothetical protein [Paenochrobactrum glaciei]|uniref:hypothetical protein n=1 Tax=Paenochrobactrum glaciei TaxID=486407 RepID=UPI0031E497DF
MLHSGYFDCDPALAQHLLNTTDLSANAIISKLAAIAPTLLAAKQLAPDEPATSDPTNQEMSASNRAKVIRAMAPDLPFLTSVLISSKASPADAAKAIGSFREADKAARENMVAVPEGGWEPNGQPVGTTISATGGMGSSIGTVHTGADGGKDTGWAKAFAEAERSKSIVIHG